MQVIGGSAPNKHSIFDIQPLYIKGKDQDQDKRGDKGNPHALRAKRGGG